MMAKLKSGRPLANRLLHHMRVEPMTVTALAKRLGVSQSYLSELLAGDKPFSAVADDVLRAAAAFLNVPPVMCFILAGRLSHSDFLEPEQGLAELLANALAKIADSPSGVECAVDLAELQGLPQAVKLLLVRTYENAEKRQLLEGKVGWSWIERGSNPGLTYLNDAARLRG